MKPQDWPTFPARKTKDEEGFRPRLSWQEPGKDEPSWRLVLQGFCLGTVNDLEGFRFLGKEAEAEPRDLRDAAICLRLKAVSAGFEVDEVPQALLGASAQYRTQEENEAKKRAALSRFLSPHLSDRGP